MFIDRATKSRLTYTLKSDELKMIHTCSYKGCRTQHSEGKSMELKGKSFRVGNTLIVKGKCTVIFYHPICILSWVNKNICLYLTDHLSGFTIFTI